MAPAVPFALLGAVQLASVAIWLGIGGAALLPRLRRRTTPLIVAGAIAMAVADAATALHLTSAGSDPIAEVRVAALVLLAAGAAGSALQPRTTVLPAIVAPLGARPSIAITGGAVGMVAAVAVWVRARDTRSRGTAALLALGLVLTAVATAMADPAQHSTDAALAVLAARGAAGIALAAALVFIARDNLLGKLLGSIVAGVVAMAVGAVAVVGVGVASEVQRDQSQRLHEVADAQQQALQALQTRAGIYANVVGLCPSRPSRCVAALKLFSVDPNYFAVVVQGGAGVRTVAPSRHALDSTALLQIAGSDVVRSALSKSAPPHAAPAGPLLLHGSPTRLAIVAAVGGRPNGVTNAQVRPTFAAVYGIGLTDDYLSALRRQIGYDVSVIAGNHVLASSLGRNARGQVLAAAAAGDVGAGGPSATPVIPARGASPTVAFEPILRPGNDNARIATLAISQPASAALAAQRSVLRRLVLTALAVLVVVALGAFAIARRVVDPVRRLTVAAERVRAGDLDSPVVPESADEIGVLAGAFDAMTSSLRGLTGDLRAAALNEAALRGRLETVVSSMTDGLVTTDGDGRVAGANPMAVQLIGEAETALVGRPLAAALDVRGVDGEPMLRRLRSSDAVDGVLHRADGTQLPVRVSVAPLADEPGEVVVFADRTRDREVERMKTEFLSNVSHELRTPLTPIRGYAELLARKPDLPPAKVQRFVAEILAGTARMNRAVELLVDVAALEAGRVVPERRSLAVKSFVDERIDQWRDRYPERSADLRRRVAAKLPPVEVDPVWLSKALDELADNAVKYTPAGTPITLAASTSADGHVRISVRDSGEGIDTDRLGELLGDFSQADASETRHVGGFGLGLGFVSRVAQALGVQMEVTSSPGRGAEFALDLPAAAAAAPPRRRRPKRAASPSASRR
jgi:PAS domain S-box-containing protein